MKGEGNTERHREFGRPVSKSTACYQQSALELGRPLRGENNRMSKHKTKNHKFKVSAKHRKGVRLSHSSDETSVMEVERRGQQNSILNIGSCVGIIDRRSNRHKWSGLPRLNRWMRIHLRAQADKHAVFGNLLLHVNAESLQEAYDEL